MKTENQARAWLKKKLENYLWKIHSRNSYGSKKKLETILKDLQKILNEFEGYIKEVKNESRRNPDK